MPTCVNTTIIKKACDLLKAGELVAIPTETVYGLAADANNPLALKKLYTTKGRPENHPVIVHLASQKDMHDWAKNIPSTAKLLAGTFWPGPLTLILEKKESVSDLLTGGQHTIGLRVPNHPVALALLNAFQGGLAAPSANTFGHISPTCKQHVEKNLGNRVSFILDGGNSEIGLESTIVYCPSDHSAPQILREGHIQKSDIEKVLKRAIDAKKTNLRTPGNIKKHYSPNATLLLVESPAFMQTVKHNENKSICVLSFSEKPNDLASQSILDWENTPKDKTFYAKNLYTWLHAFDEKKPDLILVESPPNSSEWAAVLDRLYRASA